MSTSYYHTTDSDSTCNTPRKPFTRLIAGQYHKFYYLNNAWYDRNLDANTRQIVYGDAAFDFYLDTLINAGNRVQAQRWAASMIFYALAHPVIAPTPPADVAFCERCGEEADALLCAVCETKQAEIVAFPMTGITPVVAAELIPDEITARRNHMTATKTMQAQMMADEPSAQTPNQAWQAKMDAWLAAHPLAERKPIAPITTRFAPVKKAAGF